MMITENTSKAIHLNFFTNACTVPVSRLVLEAYSLLTLVWV